MRECCFKWVFRWRFIDKCDYFERHGQILFTNTKYPNFSVSKSWDDSLYIFDMENRAFKKISIKLENVYLSWKNVKVCWMSLEKKHVSTCKQKDSDRIANSSRRLLDVFQYFLRQKFSFKAYHLIFLLLTSGPEVVSLNCKYTLTCSVR